MSAIDIDWGSISWSDMCGKCGVMFDCLASGQIDMCDVCVILFPEEAAATITKTQDTPEDAHAPGTIPQTPSSAVRPHLPVRNDPICTLCTRRVSPNDNNNGVQCTRCCNHWARRGTNLFANVGMKPTAKAQKLLENFEKEQKEMADKVEAATGVRPTELNKATVPTRTLPPSEPTRRGKTNSSAAMPSGGPAYLGHTTVSTPTVSSSGPTYPHPGNPTVFPPTLPWSGLAYHANDVVFSPTGRSNGPTYPYLGYTTTSTPTVQPNARYHARPVHYQAAVQTGAWNTTPHAHLSARNEAATQTENSNDDQLEKELYEALTGVLY